MQHTILERVLERVHIKAGNANKRDVKMNKIQTKFITGAFALASIFVSFHALAQSPNETGLRESYKTCIEQSGGVTVEMLNCTASETGYQDARLNKAYKALMAIMPKERGALLQKSERLWLDFRQANCAARVAPEGGTAESLVATECHLDSISSRAQELEDLKESIELR